MCATPSTVSPSASTPWKPWCLRTSRDQSLSPLGCASETHTTVQLVATLSGQAGSVRSARPRVWTTADSVVAVMRSMSVETPRAFQPSPSRPRVPMRTWVRPASRYAVAWATHVREVQPEEQAAIGPSPGSPRDRAPRSGSREATKAIRSCKVDSSAATTDPVTSIGWRTAGLGSVSGTFSAASAESAPASCTPSSVTGAVADARSRSHSTRTRARSPRAACSTAMICAAAPGLA